MKESAMSHEYTTDITCIELEPLGYGNPDAVTLAEKVYGREQMCAALMEIVRSGECVVLVTEKDDGCVDGREAEAVVYLDADGQKVVKSVTEQDIHERSKVAGGGYVTGLSMTMASQPGVARDVDAGITATSEILAKHDIVCGQHTGSHMSDELCDCGANDKFEIIIENGILYEQIATTTGALMEALGAPYSDAAQQKVNEGWVKTLSMPEYFADSDGRSRVRLMRELAASANTEKPAGVQKRLAGSHLEIATVIVNAPGKTFSQRKLRELLAKRFPDTPSTDLPQVFVVDAPRIIELATSLTEDEVDQQVNLQAGVSFQVATVATLTPGDLPTIILQ